MNNPVAQSKRIYFRPLELEDIKNGWQKWINDSEANEFLDGIYPQTKDNLLNYYKEQQPPKAVMFAICDKKTIWIKGKEFCFCDFRKESGSSQGRITSGYLEKSKLMRW